MSEGFGSRSINPSFSFSSPFCLGGGRGGRFRWIEGIFPTCLRLIFFHKFVSVVEIFSTYYLSHV